MNYHSRLFVAGQLCAKHCACFFPFNPYSHCPRNMLLQPSVYRRQGNGTSGKVHNLSKLLHQVRGRAVICGSCWTLHIGLPCLFSPTLTPWLKLVGDSTQRVGGGASVFWPGAPAPQCPSAAQLASEKTGLGGAGPYLGLWCAAWEGWNL